jgi:hypothetical protein
MKKSLIGLIGSAVLTLVGVWLRLNAHSMAWAGVSGWSGPASEQPWAKQEDAIGQVGMALMFAGILIFVATYFHWLFTQESDK